jgi:hypothetical protein
MKKSAPLMTLALLLNLLFAAISAGQEGTSINQLKTQIARLESIGRDANISTEVNDLNRNFLEEKRTRLAALLKARVAALRKYQLDSGPSLSAAERQVVEKAIRNLESDLKTMGQGFSLSARPRSTGTDDVSLRPSAPTSLLPVSCEACDLPDRAFVIDASTGETFLFNKKASAKCETEIAKECKDSAKTRFSKGERLPVVVINKNPFLYKYTVGVQETVIVEDALAPFLKTLSPIFANAFATSGGNAVPRLAPALGIETIRASAGCPEDKRAKAQQAYNTIRLEIERLEALRNKVGQLTDPINEDGAVAEYNKVNGAYNAALPHFARIKVSAGFKSLCQELCKTAMDLQPFLNENKIDERLNDLQRNVEALKAKAEQISGMINAFVAAYPDCEPTDNNSGLPLLRLFQNSIQQSVLGDEVPKVLDMLTQMRDRKKNEFDKMKVTLETLAARPDLLQETRYVGPFDNPTNVTVKVEYKAVTAPDAEPNKEAAKANLNFGGDKRFNLSGGVAYAFLERPEIKPILGFERDRQGVLVPNQPTPTTVIGLVDMSKKRIVPLLLLNTRLTNYRENNLFFSLGITGTADSTGTNIEYLIGPSLNVLDRRVFLTYGLYGGKVQRLNEDLYFGLKVPDATTADKLVRKDFIWKSGFSVSYKIK